MDLGSLVTGLLTGTREGVEAALIVSIILVYLARTGNRRHFGPIWLGTGAAMLLSIAVGAVLWITIGSEEYLNYVQPWFRYALIPAALVLITSLPIAGHTQAPPRRVIAVVAERFSFTPSEITMDAGETVDLRLKSDDTAHGFRIAGVVNATVPKRGHVPLVVTLGPLAPGRYAFECSRVCGAGHHFMRGVLIVRDKAAGASR